MNKSVVLSLGNGDLFNGFPAVTVQLWEDGSNPAPTKFTGSLPAAPKIAELYKSWQLLYLALNQRLDLHPRLEIDTGDITNVSEVEFGDLCQQLADEINCWLNSDSFQPIERQLRTQLSTREEIRLIIETNDRTLQRLPWHLWNFFEHYPQAEVALSACDYKKPHRAIAKTTRNRVKILAIIGDSKGINLKQDRDFLEQLAADRAEIEFLENAQPEHLSDRLWQQGWDILFFAGHSSSQEKGVIQLNEQSALSLDKFKYALKKAIERGLKLAIFNSCDGLGLAQDLADLHIPQVIVMREVVPDVVAQEFLKHFLTAFSSGQSLYVAVREARERLQKLETQYPCATWLPVICQNPAEVPTTWQQWHTPNDRFLLGKRCLPMLLASVLVSSLVVGARQLGIFQSWELQAFDQTLRSRPSEEVDPRILIVTVTEQDVQNQDAQERRSASLSDRALGQLIKKIHPFQPQVIGLDIYRDFPVEPKQSELKTYLQQSDRFIAICEVGEANVHPGIKPPPEVPGDRLSFSDIPVDSDLVIRRQLLGMSSSEQSACQSDTSFSLRVALTYLGSQGIEFERTAQGNLKIGSVVFPKLESNIGGYRNLNALGYQILLNYRSSKLVARQVTLSSMLSNSIDAELPNLVKNRIILIGTTASSFKDYFATPYGPRARSGEMPGIIVQAHMVSQILSAVLDGRPLLWWFPGWGETLWIWGWSFIGGLIVWRYRLPVQLGLASGIAVVVLYGVCFVLLLKGGWVPFVPGAIALVVTASTMVVYRRFLTQQKQE